MCGKLFPFWGSHNRIVVIYLDDILIFTRTIEQYTKAIWRVLEILAEYQIYLYPKKYKF